MLFAVIFFWTPPHFWALAIKYRDDYAAADVPMLPSVASLRTTAIADRRATRSCCGRSPWCSCPVGAAWAGSTWSPRSCSAPCSPALAVQLLRPRRRRRLAMRLFAYSITYITLLFGAMAVDQLVRCGF